MNGIRDSVAIVTGASSGIGRAAAMRFATEGANVVAADVDAEGGEATVDMIHEDGGEAAFVETDVSDRDDVEAMVAEAVERYGGLDFAFNNAGMRGPTTRWPTRRTTADSVYCNCLPVVRRPVLANHRY